VANSHSDIELVDDLKDSNHHQIQDSTDHSNCMIVKPHSTSTAQTNA